MKTGYRHYFKEPAPLNNLLERHPLRSLLIKARQLAKANQVLLTSLPEELNKHCEIVNMEHETAVIGVRNAAWLTRLRYQQTMILQELEHYAHTAHIKKLRFTIMASWKS